MSKVFNLYTKDQDGNDIDRTWYQSSNVKYSECVDRDNELKVLRVVFNNASQYEYKNVDVSQYLLFRDAESQGKALNQYIKAKNYQYEKLENADLATLDGELSFRIEGGVFIDYDGNVLKMRDNKDGEIFNKEVKLDKDALDTVCGVLVAVGKDVKLTTTDEFDAAEAEK